MMRAHELVEHVAVESCHEGEGSRRLGRRAPGTAGPAIFGGFRGILAGAAASCTAFAPAACSNGADAQDPDPLSPWNPATLLDTRDFPSRWHCGTWTGLHGWTHVVADLSIWVAYMAIPAMLLVLLRRRPDVPFPAVLLLFVAFIVCCGMTHLAEAAMFWWPAYRLMGLVKVVTAVVSLGTVFALVHFVPRMLLLRSPEQLEREVQTRTAELELARRQAQGAAEARARFTANISHELRTPMAAVLGYADVLAADPQLADAQRHHVRVIQRNGHHLLSIINDVLDLARSEAGKLPLSLEPCSVEALVQECVEMLRERASSKGLALEAPPPAEPLPPLWLDPVRVRQVLINLLGNAIKFTSTGRVAVTVRSRPLDEGRLQLEFDVSDTGIGMTPEQAERAFDEFTQADGSLTRRYGGSGLGLTLSRRLADAMQGTLSIAATAPDAGTTVRFALPATPSPQPSPAAAAAAAEAGPPRLEGCRLLVAEDAPDTAMLVQNVLTGAGAEVACVHDGSAAVAAVLAADDAQRPFDAVLIDVQMPELDGLSATRLLRARGHAGPIVAFTAHAGDEARDESLRAGCTAHLTKPVRPGDLLRAVAAVLGRASAGAAAGSARATGR